MTWEAGVYLIGNVMWDIGSLPSILKRNPPAKTTCLTGVVILLAFSVAAYSALSTPTAVVTFIGAVLWAVLLLQRIRLDQKPSNPEWDIGSIPDYGGIPMRFSPLVPPGQGVFMNPDDDRILARIDNLGEET